ncbi:MAG TPA: hypothetical protein VHE55_13980 [Fimbriimonadaceae bacterium]|nr:hypothetical protein [Fimbriimonadaceae bacterium]
MNKTIILAAAIVGAALTTGCHPSGGGSGTSGYVPKKSEPLPSALLPAGQEADYFPFVAGNQWTFSSETKTAVNGLLQPPKTQEVTYRLSQVVPSADNGKDAWFAVMNDGKTISREIWRSNANGLYQVGSGKDKPKLLNPPQLLVPFPVKIGQTFHWSANVTADNGTPLVSTIDGTVTGQEQIDTEMGPYNALAVEGKGSVKGKNLDSKVTVKLWLIPKIGIGRYLLTSDTVITSSDPKLKGRSARKQVIQLMKLKNFTPKK